MTKTPLNQHSDYTIKIVLSESLAADTQQVVTNLRENPKNPETGKAAILLLQEAVRVNLEFYFIKPAKKLKMGSLGLKVLTMGTNTVVKLVATVGNKVVQKLSPEQMSNVADFIEDNLVFRAYQPDDSD